ncbi:MAG TPA: IPT/TIG domain-containing protein [Solirubrobacteraceae bacterium]|nr:IPT/TIG domain-containing protein [Solirubrobacteraceae bacterium]
MPGTETTAKATGKLALGVIAVAAVLLGCASHANAVIVHLHDGRTVSYLPDLHATRSAAGPLVRLGAGGGGESGSGKVSYHGGPVMSSNTDYAFYWAPGGTAEYPAGYLAGINGFFANLAHDSGTDTNDDSVAAQYSDAEGEYAEYEVKFGGAIVDTDPYPGDGCHRAAICLTEEQLLGELEAYITAHHLPQNLTTGYFILTPPEVESCLEAAGRVCSAGTAEPGYCAYHSYFKPEGTGATLLFADDPYSTGIEGCDTGKHPSESIAEGTIQGGLEHEHAEMISDPTLHAWFNSANGEIGDICRTFEAASEFGTPLGTAPDGAPYNQLINGGEYLFQQLWSNEADACAQRRTWPMPTITKVAPRGGPSQGGTTVKISGEELRNTKAVYFAGVASPDVKIVSGDLVEALTPAGATGEAPITLVTGHGASEENAHDTFKYGAPTVTAVTPDSGAVWGGGRVTITGSGFGAGTSFVFGKPSAREVECQSATSCQVTVPVGPKAGTVAVRARTDGKRSSRSQSGEYTYE